MKLFSAFAAVALADPNQIQRIPICSTRALSQVEGFSLLFHRTTVISFPQITLNRGMSVN